MLWSSFTTFSLCFLGFSLAVDLSLHYTILLLAGSHIAQLPGTIRESYNMYDNNMYDSLYMYMIQKINTIMHMSHPMIFFQYMYYTKTTSGHSTGV